MKSRFFAAGLLLALLAGCGTAEQPTVTVALRPTVTPFDIGQPTATVQATDTAELTRAANVQAGKDAIAAKDYPLAIEHLTQAYSANRSDQSVALLLAQAYQLNGASLLERENRTADGLREAFDSFSDGAEAAPEGDPLQETLLQDQKATQAALEAQLALDRYNANTDDLDARKADAEAAHAALQLILELRPEFPNLKPLQSEILVALGQVRERSARELSGDERKTLLLEARDLCAQARDLWPEDAEEAEPSQECLARVAARLNPPKATATPKPQQANPGNNNDPRLSFGGYIQTGFPQGGNTGRFESCVSGRVLRADGSGIGAASGNVNNGSASVQWTTNGDGFFRVCGLGFSNWGATLFYVPGPGLRSEASIYGIWLDGTPGQDAFVVFKAR